MNAFKQTAGLFLLGGAGYGALEILWRGHTHWTMVLTGGFVFLGLWLLDRQMHSRPMLLRCAYGMAWVTAAELLVGLCVNVSLHMGVWDYSGAWGNVLGQVCPQYAGLWFLLCAPAMALARQSANLLANPYDTRYNTGSITDGMRGKYAYRTRYWQQPYTVRRFLRG